MNELNFMPAHWERRRALDALADALLPGSHTIGIQITSCEVTGSHMLRHGYVAGITEFVQTKSVTLPEGAVEATGVVKDFDALVAALRELYAALSASGMPRRARAVLTIPDLIVHRRSVRVRPYRSMAYHDAVRHLIESDLGDRCGGWLIVAEDALITPQSQVIVVVVDQADIEDAAKCVQDAGFRLSAIEPEELACERYRNFCIGGEGDIAGVGMHGSPVFGAALRSTFALFREFDSDFPEAPRVTSPVAPFGRRNLTDDLCFPEFRDRRARISRSALARVLEVLIYAMETQAATPDDAFRHLAVDREHFTRSARRIFGRLAEQVIAGQDWRHEFLLQFRVPPDVALFLERYDRTPRMNPYDVLRACVLYLRTDSFGKPDTERFAAMARERLSVRKAG